MRRDTRLPEKLRNMKCAEIGLAAKIDLSDGESIISVENSESILFAYMPTKISAYNFPLLVNTNFLTSANREQIHADSIWNQGLFSLIPRQIMRYLIELTQDSRWCRTAYQLIPRPTNAKDALATDYNDSCSKTIANEKFIRAINGDYLSANEAVLDLTQLSQQSFIDNESIRQFILQTYKPTPNQLGAHPFVAYHARLNDLNIRKFDWTNAVNMLHSTHFQQAFSVDRCKGLITFIFEHRSEEAISQRLQQLPFLLDQNQRLRTTTDVYFPLQLNDALWKGKDYSEACVHNDIMSWLTPTYHDWLMQRGVIVKTNLSYVHRTIIPNASTFITSSNAVESVRKLFFLFRSRQISSDDLEKLNKLSLLTLDNRLRPAHELYFSAPYQPRLPLEILQPTQPQLFVSSIYMRPEERPCEWKHFFSLLAVEEDIDLIVLQDTNRLFQDYQYEQNQLIFGLGSQPVRRYEHRLAIRFLELTENDFRFAAFFWRYVIQKLDVKSLLKSETAFWGKDTRSGMKQGSEVNNFPQWFIRARPCIPVVVRSSLDGDTRTCLRAFEVFSSLLTPLIGHYLPVFECDKVVPAGWQQFFRFKTELSVQDHLYLLQQIAVEHRDQTECDVESDRRIQDIYTSLLTTHLAGIDDRQRQLYREQCQSMGVRLLCAVDNRFMPPEALAVWLVDCWLPPSRLCTLKLSRNNWQYSNLACLLEVLNVRQIRTNDLTFRPVSPRPCEMLREGLQSQYLVEWFAANQFVSIGLQQISTMQFVEVDRIEIYVNDNTMYVDCKETHVEGNHLFVKGPWQCNELLLPTLCELLGLPYELLQVPFKRLIDAPSIEDYFDQSGHLTAASPVDLEQIIEQENAVLFEQLGDSSSLTDLSQLLIAGLDAQESPWKGYVYHYTHIENALSILRDRSLRSRRLMMTEAFTDSAATSVINQTDERTLEHVRFYFRPRTPTQFCNENLGSEVNCHRYGNIPMCPVPVFFRIRLRALLAMPNLCWKVSLGTMASRHTEYGSEIDIVRRFDFRGVYQDSHTERGKCSSQQEFLIETDLDLTLIPVEDITLVFQDANARQSLELMYAQWSTTNYRTEINEGYFFRINPRINVVEDEERNYVSVSITEGRRSRADGLIIVQVQSLETPNLACQGNVWATLRDGRVTTIYKRHTLYVYVSKQSYAVYYEDEQHRWLIHTNHGHPRFDPDHMEQHPMIASRMSR